MVLIRPVIASSISEAKGMTSKCTSINGTRTLGPVCPTQTSQTGRALRGHKQERTLWKVVSA